MPEYFLKTFGEDMYGRHALAVAGQPGDVFGFIGRSWPTIHVTRVSVDYVGRHCA